MACGVTLKRSLELDIHLSPECSIKRPRTGHFSPFTPAPTNSQSPVVTGPFANVSCSMSSLSQDDIESYVRTEISQLQRRRLIPSRRKLIRGDPGSPPSSQSSSDSEPETNSTSFRHQLSKSATGANRKSAGVEREEHQESAKHPLELATFTMKQVQLICARLLREQEEKLRQEYEQILQNKLAEQYETFVQFTNDQVHRRFEDMSLSYVS